MKDLLHAFPGHARLRAVRLLLEPWSIEYDLPTPTIKLKWPEIERLFPEEICQLHAGDDIFALRSEEVIATAGGIFAPGRYR